MLPGNAKVLECPFCGAKKEILSLMSGNTFGGRQWSDTKCEYPMMPDPSPIQKCPHCGKFYFIDMVNSSEGENCSLEQGNLSYEELKLAAAQFEDPSAEALDDVHRVSLYLNLLYAYNEEYNRPESKSEAPQEEVAYMTNIMNEMLDSDQVDIILKGELLRELGRFDEALEQLNWVREQYPDFAWVLDKLIDHARQKDPKPFVVTEK